MRRTTAVWPLERPLISLSGPSAKSPTHLGARRGLCVLTIRSRSYRIPLLVSACYPEKENTRLKRLVAELSLEKQVLQDVAGGKLLSPERRRCAVERAEMRYGMSERHACRLLGQSRGTQRYEPMRRADEDRLTAAVVALASEYGRYGYKKIAAIAATIRMASRPGPRG